MPLIPYDEYNRITAAGEATFRTDHMRTLRVFKRGFYGRKHKNISETILDDLKIKLIETVDTLKISKERVGHIFHELIVDQKQNRIYGSEQFLELRQ